MKVCVFGAGGAGGLIAAHLALSGRAEVSLVARGAHLDALRGQGLRLLGLAGETRVDVGASDDSSTLGPQDYVVLALRAPAVTAALPAIAMLLGPETCLVTIQNGIPWWYFHRHGGVFEKLMLDATNSLGRIWLTLGPERALGCVLHVRAERTGPGVVRHLGGGCMAMGEPSGETTPRATAFAGALETGGLAVSLEPQIRARVWARMSRDAFLGPVASLTGATPAALAADPGTRAVLAALRTEAAAVAAAFGEALPETEPDGTDAPRSRTRPAARARHTARRHRRARPARAHADARHRPRPRAHPPACRRRHRPLSRGRVFFEVA